MDETQMETFYQQMAQISAEHSFVNHPRKSAKSADVLFVFNLCSICV